MTSLWRRPLFKPDPLQARGYNPIETSSWRWRPMRKFSTATPGDSMAAEKHRNLIDAEFALMRADRSG